KNERFLITRVNPTYEEIRSAKIKKVKEDKMPKDSLFIFNIKNKSKNIFTHIKSIQTAPTIVNYIAFQSESSVPDSLENAEKEDKKTPKNNSVLHLLNLETGDTINFQHVDKYYLSNDEKNLL